MRKILFCLLILVAPLLQARIINVSEHGIRPGEDAMLKLNRLLESVAGEPDITLVFPKGQYEFHPANAVEKWQAVANHDNSLKRMAFPLFKFKNVTIDGGGSTFMFHGRISPFVLEGTEGATLKNFSIDWDRPFHDELPVVESNDQEGYIVLEVDPKKYPMTVEGGKMLSQKYDWQDEMGSNIVFDPKTRAPIYNTKDYSINFRAHKASKVGENRIKLETKFRKAPPVGSVLITYGTHPTSRLCPAIHLANCANVEIKDVTVYAAGGMALIAERTNNIHLDGMKVTSTADRLVSTRADATHFLGCKGEIRVENCLFEHMLDDGINVHGAYIKVEEYLGQNEFLCEISHFQQWGLIFAEAGDRVALLSRDTILPFHQTTVTGTRILNEHRVIVTVADTPKDLPKGPMSMENLTWYPSVTFTKNTIRENRARGLLITTRGKVLIEDNYISSQMHGILIEGDNNVWYESGAVEDVVIRNNNFVNPGFEGGAAYPLYASPLLNNSQHMGDGHYHRNIHFLNNTIKSFNGLLAFATSVKGLELIGNTLTFSTDYPKVTEFPSIDLHYCDDVTIRNNKTEGFDRALEIKASDDTTHVVAEANPGFEAK